MPLLIRTTVLATVAGLTVSMAGPRFLTYDNTPLGTEEEPLVLRTFMPDPGLDDEVFAFHGRAGKSPKYSPKKGEDVPGEYEPVAGIVGAIGVNYGASLSYCFDTTECRLMYAWQGGFLDMYPYWGTPERGNRLSSNYVPHLVGNLFLKADGTHPVMLNGRSVTADGIPPEFRGYTIDNGILTFRYYASGYNVTVRIEPTDEPMSIKATINASPPPRTVGFRLPDGSKTEVEGKDAPLMVVMRGEPIASFQGFPRNTRITRATVEAGESLYQNYGCIACHSLDGSKGHGPTFDGLFGSRRRITDADEPVVADPEYILESIREPNAKTVEGYPPNYMPPYQLKDIENESLILFIKSLGGQPE